MVVSNICGCTAWNLLHITLLRLLLHFWKACAPLRCRMRFKTAIYLRNVKVNSLLVIKGLVKCSRPMTCDSSFILVINQPDAQNLFYNKFISYLYMFRAPCAHRQEVKIVLHSLWYHQTYRCDDRLCNTILTS